MIKYVNYSKIQLLLLNWFEENKRDLPWRNTSNPYLIWLSEIILQQTRVAQGLDYYLRISERFPDVDSLANAKEDELLKLWQGLGYYSRARNMHSCAKQIVEKFDSVFPTEYEQIISLKGIGTYTAAAISSIAYNKPFAVVDGNVIRVLSRLFAVDEDVFNGKGKKIIENLANELLDKINPGQFNQAMMEYGALYCVPQNPDCENCVLRKFCRAKALNKVDLLPVKKKNIEKRIRYFQYTIPVFDFEGRKSTLLVRRTQEDVWKNLFQFPLFENVTAENTSAFDFHPDLKPFFQDFSIKSSRHYTHILSHQKIEADFTIFECFITDFSSFSEPYIIVPLNELKMFAMPRLVDRFLVELNF